MHPLADAANVSKLPHTFTVVARLIAEAHLF